MPDFLTNAYANAPHTSPLTALIRLATALLLGSVVAAIYRHTRKSTQIAASFPTTLILLSVLIAMVTQVIGDNVARAFSLVGALSIVRFRTVVRDTQDTAYVIFAVVVGMSVGAQNLWIAVIGIGVIGSASFWTWARLNNQPDARPAYLLTLRLTPGLEPDQLLADGSLAHHLEARELLSVGTPKQGIAMEFVYETRLRPEGSAAVLVQALHRLEGVQGVQLRRRGFDEP